MADSEECIEIENNINPNEAWIYAFLSEMAYRRANADLGLG